MKTRPFSAWFPRLLLGLLLPLLLAGMARGSGPVEPPALTPKETAFLQSAFQSGTDKVKLADLGVSKTTDAAVKEAARQLMLDHQKLNGEMMALATAKKVEMSDAATPEVKKLMEELNKKEGREFDRAFIEAMLQWHVKDVKLFDAAAPQAMDEQVKLLITNVTPILKEFVTKLGMLQGAPGQGTSIGKAGVVKSAVAAVTLAE